MTLADGLNYNWPPFPNKLRHDRLLKEQSLLQDNLWVVVQPCLAANKAKLAAHIPPKSEWPLPLSEEPRPTSYIMDYPRTMKDCRG
jgi:hypothetical protein